MQQNIVKCLQVDVPWEMAMLLLGLLIGYGEREGQITLNECFC